MKGLLTEWIFPPLVLIVNYEKVSMFLLKVCLMKRNIHTKIKKMHSHILNQNQKFYVRLNQSLYFSICSDW